MLGVVLTLSSSGLVKWFAFHLHFTRPDFSNTLLGKLPIERRPFWSADVDLALDDVNAFIKTLVSDQVIIFETNKVLANSDGRVYDQYSRDFLHLNPTGYAVLNEAIAELLVTATQGEKQENLFGNAEP